MRDKRDRQAMSAAIHAYTLTQRLGMLLFNATSLLLCAGFVLVVAWPWAAVGWRVATGLTLLYLVPPLLARLVLGVSPVRQGRIVPGSADFFKWWCVFNLQALFCRFPSLEEALRVIPGLYSAWLRLWGARIGRLTYWAAGTMVLDRSFVRIGNDVVFGAGVRINPHVMTRNDRGEMELLLADIVIGDGAVIGGYSLLTTGTVVDPGECTRACLLSPPFTRWQRGTRTREEERIHQPTGCRGGEPDQ